MTEYITKERAKDLIVGAAYSNSARLARMLFKLEDEPPADVVLRAVFEQVKWERDVAIKQLESYGIGLGEKADVARIVRSKDCVKNNSCQLYNDERFPFFDLGFCCYGWDGDDHD